MPAPMENAEDDGPGRIRRPAPIQDGGGDSRPPRVEKRREVRIPLPIHVELYRQSHRDEIPSCAVLRNMSENGVCLEHADDLQVGEIVSIKLLDLPLDLPCEYRVLIIWQQEGPPGEFTSGGQVVADSKRMKDQE